MMPPAAGSPAPAFELEDLESRRVRFVPDAPGFKALVFYKNSCPTCQFAMPYFDRLHTRGAPGQACVQAVSQDSPEEALAFAQAYGVTMPQLVDPAPYKVSRLYRIMNVPTLLVVDAGGRIVLSSPAFIKADLLEAARLLAAGSDPPEMFSPGEEVPQLKPG